MFSATMPTPLSMTEMRTPPARRFDAQRDGLVRAARIVASVLGVAHEVHQDLQHFVLVDGDRRDLAEFALQRHAVAHEGAGIQAQAVLDQVGDRDGLVDAAEPGIALLHRDGVLDVLEIVAQQRELVERGALIVLQRVAERGEVLRNALAALVVRDELTHAGALLEQQRCQARDALGLRLSDALGDEARRYVDAVENVADIVQNVGGDLRHARFARGRHQLLVHPFELQFLTPALRDVLDEGHGAQGLSLRTGEPAGDRQSGARRLRVAGRDDELEVVDGLAAQRARQRPVGPLDRRHAIGEIHIRRQRIGVRRPRLRRDRAAPCNRAPARRDCNE